MTKIKKKSHAPFHSAFLWWSMALSVLLGFGIAAHLSIIIGFHYPLHADMIPLIQSHGHLQLIGWAGLFIMGVSLYFLPRLSGVPISHPALISVILWLMCPALLIRGYLPMLLPFEIHTKWFFPLLSFIAFSGVLEFAGIFLYLWILLRCLFDLKKPVSSAYADIRPWMGMMLSGWFFYALLNAGLLIQMWFQKAIVLDISWNELSIRIFIGLTLLPICIAVSSRLMPLYFHTPFLGKKIFRAAWVYLFFFLLKNIPEFLFLSFPHFPNCIFLMALGQMGRAAVLIFIVWNIGVFSFNSPLPQDASAFDEKGIKNFHASSKKLFRSFGPFERLIQAAYLWLTLACIIEIIQALAVLSGGESFFREDFSRHLYLAGFVTHLILGVSVQMVPGFWGKLKVAKPWLVTASFCFASAAVLGRTLLFIFPREVIQGWGRGLHFLEGFYAFSGSMGMLAILCLWWNLVATKRS